MGDSREGSPDWLREFQAPTQNLLTLSSSSDSSPEASPKSSKETRQPEPEIFSKKQDKIVINIGEDSPVVNAKIPKTSRTEKKKENEVIHEGPAEEDTGEAPAEEDTRDAPAGPSVSSRLPLVFPERTQRSKALVECDGDAIDLSGDVGAVGRIVISNDPAGKKEMTLDLKGNFYKSTIVPSRTFCIISVGQTEAKIEAIMNDFIQLEPQSNVFEAETLIEGTLNGSFDSDEEGEKLPKTTAQQTEENNANGNQTNKKAKRKAETSQGGAKLKAKAASRPPKAVKRTKKSNK